MPPPRTTTAPTTPATISAVSFEDGPPRTLPRAERRPLERGSSSSREARRDEPDCAPARALERALVRPERRIPLVVTRRTGITGRSLEGAPFAEEALNDLLDFVGLRTCVTDQADLAQRFLRVR